MDHARRQLHAIWDAAGATGCWTLDCMAHQAGTCRMGADRSNSAVNADGRSHDIENPYICDNSIFPTSLAANPALTIMRSASAVRTDF